MNSGKFFRDDDDFQKIICKHIKNVQNIEGVDTGWTNYVFKVTAENDDKLNTFIFRFPRNLFFAETLLKECKIMSFVKDKISFLTPNLVLNFDNGRPYTYHESIEGQSLSSCYNELNLEELKELSIDICRLLDEFKNIDINSEEFEKVSNFLDRLSDVSAGDFYDLSQHDGLKSLENKNLVFSHGDFNPGNLILKNHKLVGVIDFAFAGVSSELTDLSRIIGRCPESLKNVLVESYEKKFQHKVLEGSLKTLIDTWQYVEVKYIDYIRLNHPSIILPNLV